MGLHVGILGSEKLLDPLPRQLFDHVGKPATAVVTFAGIAFGVLVGKHRTGGFEHRFAHEVLGGNQLQTLVLAAGFVVDGQGYFRIGFVEGA